MMLEQVNKDRRDGLNMYSSGQWKIIQSLIEVCVKKSRLLKSKFWQEEN